MHMPFQDDIPDFPVNMRLPIPCRARGNRKVTGVCLNMTHRMRYIAGGRKKGARLLY